MVAQRRLIDHVEGLLPGRLDLANAGRRTQVIGDAVRPAEAGRGDDFLVIDALAAIAGLDAMFGVPLARDRAELTIGRHGKVSGKGGGPVTASAPAWDKPAPSDTPHDPEQPALTAAG